MASYVNIDVDVDVDVVKSLTTTLDLTPMTRFPLITIPTADSIYPVKHKAIEKQHDHVSILSRLGRQSGSEKATATTMDMYNINEANMHDISAASTRTARVRRGR